jgi:hypothetical protein
MREGTFALLNRPFPEGVFSGEFTVASGPKCFNKSYNWT